MQEETSRFSVCIKNDGYPASLELHKLYRIVPDDSAARDGDIRVIDESGENYLYSASYFLEIDLPKTAKEILLRTA